MSKKKRNKNRVAAKPAAKSEEVTEESTAAEEKEETAAEEAVQTVSKKDSETAESQESAAEENETVESAAEKTEAKKKEKPARTVKTVLEEAEMSKSKIFLVLSFLVPFLIMGFVFAKAEIFPFGERQVLYSDSKQQYLPFLREFQEKLKTGESMYYTWHSGMGTNFVAIIAYYLASPINLLSLFVPAKYIREAFAVFMMIKIGCAGLFTAMFLKHVYRRNDLSLVAFGCCYAFCNFITGYYWNTIWLDSVALLPLVALGVYCIVHENKYKTYVVALALAFLSSYYIGYMICVFVVLWFIIQSVIKGFKLEKFCEDVLKMAGYSILALAMTLPITLTAYIQLQNTVGTEDSFPSKLEIYNNFMEVLANLMSFHEPTTMEGLPNIGTGVICILMLVIFVRSKEIECKEKVSLLTLLGFLFVSLNINVLDFVWHGFHFPNLIPYRFAFIFSFVFIVVAYRAFTVFVQLDKKDIIGMCIVTVVMVCISVFYLEREAIIGSLIVAGLYIVFMTLYELNLLDRRLLMIFTSLVIIAEMCFQANIGVKTVGTTNHNDFPASQEQVNELVDYAQEISGEDLFRIDQVYYSTKNDGMSYGYNSAGQFSSTSYKGIIDFTSKFGLVSKRSSFQYLLTSPVTAMFLNEKYMISRDGFYGNETSLTEIKKSADGTATLYENEYYLPIGYMADNNIQTADMDYKTVFKTQNKVFTALTGVNEKVYTMLAPTSADSTNFTYEEESDGLYDLKLQTGETKGKITLRYTAPKDGMIYAWANVKSAKKVQVRSARIDHEYETDGQRYIFPLGYYKKGEVVAVTIDADKSAKNKLAVAYLNEDVLKKGYANLADETLSVTKYNSRTVEGTVTAKTDGTFMTSIPYEKGWTLTVDGKKVETKQTLGAFICADLTKGEHTIEFKYTPQGFVPGMVLGMAALLVFVFLCVNDYLKKKKDLDIIAKVLKK